MAKFKDMVRYLYCTSENKKKIFYPLAAFAVVSAILILVLVLTLGGSKKDCEVVDELPESYKEQRSRILTSRRNKAAATLKAYSEYHPGNWTSDGRYSELVLENVKLVEKRDEDGRKLRDLILSTKCGRIVISIKTIGNQSLVTKISTTITNEEFPSSKCVWDEQKFRFPTENGFKCSSFGLVCEYRNGVGQIYFDRLAFELDRDADADADSFYKDFTSC